MDWPPFSPDLTPFDYSLWGKWKHTVFWYNPATLHELEELICAECAYISFDTLQRATENFILDMRHSCAAQSAHILCDCMQRTVYNLFLRLCTTATASRATCGQHL
ncbi:hypothetical protein AVEN_69989-1 [Araneus ventricosus]|uniref:Tc1-like transposase DDE domain-containing protein n=1 Tax=Araneus ventricosus TaxID=182803 RepID=A0A4Y2N333_ARAVE|nr:hypothetical protein AVEN_69989-1 [Araneus ventricosus]